jgi:hypothetical protein
MEDEKFEAISHSLRIRILTLSSQKAMGFAELKSEVSEAAASSIFT